MWERMGWSTISVNSVLLYRICLFPHDFKTKRATFLFWGISRIFHKEDLTTGNSSDLSPNGPGIFRHLSLLSCHREDNLGSSLQKGVQSFLKEHWYNLLHWNSESVLSSVYVQVFGKKMPRITAEAMETVGIQGRKAKIIFQCYTVFPTVATLNIKSIVCPTINFIHSP